MTVEHASKYINEAAYKYNTRKSETPFSDFMFRAVGQYRRKLTLHCVAEFNRVV